MADNDKILRPDLVVIGAGPGGYAAAFHAADKGLDVTLIDENPRPGGVCLHVGCIPSKALLHAAEVIQTSRHAANWGIKFGEPQLDLARLREWKNEVVDKLVGGLEQLGKTRGVRYVQGRAVFIDSERLRLEESAHEMLVFKKAILATGSSVVIPEAFRKAGDRVMDSTGALALADIPERLLVIGGGYIGLEMATVYAALGSKVTVVEMLEGLLPGVDRDLARPVAKRIKEVAEAVYTGTKVEKIQQKDNELEVTLSGQEEPLRFDRALVAIGRRPNSSGIGLENTEVQIDGKGFVVVDERRATDDPNIYAIGDVAGEPMLAHKAHHEGIVAVDAIAGEPAAFDVIAIPAVVFTDPELAWVGITETEAERDGIEVEVRRFPWGASGRAVTLDRTDGLTKIICEPETGRIWGMGIVGKGAGELIAEGALAIEMGATAEDLAATIHPHPTISETLMESAELVGGMATHLYRPQTRKAKK